MDIRVGVTTDIMLGHYSQIAYQNVQIGDKLQEKPQRSGDT